MEEENKELEEKVEEKNDSRVKKIIINSIIVIVIIIISIIMYAKYFGTKGISVLEYRIADENIPSNFSGVKIIYFSDVLIGSTVNVQDVEIIVNKINELKPDIVLFGGGLISEGYNLKEEDKEKLIELFSNINVTLGKYSVSGYEDNELFTEVVDKSGFISLLNNYEYIYKDEEIPICLVGIDSYNLGKSNLESSFGYIEDKKNCYTIVFTHEADVINKILSLEVKPKVILAGNGLGGEINIPFYGSLKKFEGNIDYNLPYEEVRGMKVFVSNGIGTKEYFMRLNNRPTISLFRLKSLH